jgi:glutamate carboxypeptidase
MLYTLKALENSIYQGKIGWEVLITPDEELGSPASHKLFNPMAKRNHIGLIFEPAYADGSIVDSRKGSFNYTVISKGRSAHAGRDFFDGFNAILPLAQFALLAAELSNKKTGITLNIGSLKGGEAANVIPDMAICKLNIRAWDQEQLLEAKLSLESIIARLNKTLGSPLSLHEDTFAPPKPCDENIQSLLQILSQAAVLLGFNFQTHSSGGVCDGSRLYAEGLPNIDTLGIVGGGLHTTEEFALLPSLIERTQLATLFVLLFVNQKHQLIL